MTDWKLVSSNDKPSLLDDFSSPTTIYIRRNITESTKIDEITGKEYTEYQYEERKMTPTEYNNMLIVQDVINNNTQEIVASVTEFQKEEVIDEYTQQLIEEGVI